MRFLSIGLLWGQVVFPASLNAVLPVPIADCQDRLRHTYDLFDQLQQRRTQEQGIMEIHFTAGTTYQRPGQKKLSTTTAHFTLLSKADHSYLSNEEVDLYRDAQVQVSVVRSQQLILITSAQAQMPNVFSQLLKMREQMRTQAVISQCTLLAGKGRSPARRFLEARPLPGGAMDGKVSSIAYWLDPRTDALQQMIMYYPPGTGLNSVSLVVESQRIKQQDKAVDLPALQHVFGQNNQLLPAYRSFKVQDQRHS